VLTARFIEAVPLIQILAFYGILVTGLGKLSNYWQPLHPELSCMPVPWHRCGTCPTDQMDQSNSPLTG